MNTVGRSAVRHGLADVTIRALSGAYGLGEWLRCERTPKGSANLSFFVSTPAGDFVLRRSHSRKTVEALSFELDLISYLRSADYPAPEVIGTSGEDYVRADGTFFLLTARIPGGAYDPGSEPHLQAAGVGLARFHSLARAFPGPVPPTPSPLAEVLDGAGSRAIDEAENLSTAVLDAPRRDALGAPLNDIRAQVSDLRGRLAELSSGFTHGVVHGSFGRSALIFQGEDLNGVVDYDRAGAELIGIDLAYSLKAFCRVDDSGGPGFRIGLDYGRCRRFLAAYRTEEKLSDAELAALPLLFRAQRLLKVLKKCQNLVRKNAEVPQARKDFEKLATIAEREAIRLQWLQERESEMLSALA